VFKKNPEVRQKFYNSVSNDFTQGKDRFKNLFIFIYKLAIKIKE